MDVVILAIPCFSDCNRTMLKEYSLRIKTEPGKTATLFRGMTVGAKLASIYLHMKGRFFLKGVLQPLIAQMQSSEAIEVKTQFLPFFKIV